MTTSILFVCLGNICRSPAAEAVMRARAPQLSLDSAGTGGWHVGQPPYGPMQEAARGRGYDMSALRARQFSAGDFLAFDLILAMDPQNLADIEVQRPGGTLTPVKLFTDYLPGDSAFAGATEVPDPYYTRDFDGALALIEDCAGGLVASLR
ncbi:MAG: low molecular weight phosphotyrosine protein phosphatase [Rhodobacteraceae bacterium]|nr:low molecular weight phosphotyrosine protein phosphatase [Paracoccaceae bacterium]MBR9820460.1 low molecular weight phosphotyrosine protein phosphatase [Paracoccaceae bacterium]